MLSVNNTCSRDSVPQWVRTKAHGKTFGTVANNKACLSCKLMLASVLPVISSSLRDCFSTLNGFRKCKTVANCEKLPTHSANFRQGMGFDSVRKHFASKRCKISQARLWAQKARRTSKSLKRNYQTTVTLDVYVALYVSIHHVPSTVLVCGRVPETQWRMGRKPWRSRTSQRVHPILKIFCALRLA